MTAPYAHARTGGLTALAGYLEAAGRLAAEVVALGDAALAEELLDEAARVAAAVRRGRPRSPPDPVTAASDTPPPEKKS